VKNEIEKGLITGKDANEGGLRWRKNSGRRVGSSQIQPKGKKKERERTS